jgi:hypothetical protein
MGFHASVEHVPPSGPEGLAVNVTIKLDAASVRQFARNLDLAARETSAP